MELVGRLEHKEYKKYKISSTLEKLDKLKPISSLDKLNKLRLIKDRPVVTNLDRKITETPLTKLKQLTRPKPILEKLRQPPVITSAALDKLRKLKPFNIISSGNDLMKLYKSNKQVNVVVEDITERKEFTRIEDSDIITEISNNTTLNSDQKTTAAERVISQKYNISSKETTRNLLVWLFVKNRKKIIYTAVIAAAIGLSAVVIFMYIGAASLPAFLGLLQSLGIKKMAVYFLLDIAKSLGTDLASTVSVKLLTNRLKTNPYYRRKLSARVFPKFLTKIGAPKGLTEMTLEDTLESMIKNTAQFAANPALVGFLIGKGVGLGISTATSVIPKAASVVSSNTRKLATSTFDILSHTEKSIERKLVRNIENSTHIDPISITNEVVNEVDHKLMEAENKIINETELNKDKVDTKKTFDKLKSSIQKTESQKRTKQSINTNRKVAVAAGLGAALTTLLLTGQAPSITGVIVPLLENSIARKVSFTLLTEGIGLNNMIKKLGLKLTVEQLRKIKSLNKKIKGLSGSERDTYLKEFYDAIYGKLYSEKEIRTMNKEDLIIILKSKQVQHKRDVSVDILKQLLRKKQSEVHNVTYNMLMESLTDKVLKAGVMAATTSALEKGYSSYKDTIIDTLRLNPEINNPNSPYYVTPEQKDALTSLSNDHDFVNKYLTPDIENAPVMETIQNPLAPGNIVEVHASNAINTINKLLRDTNPPPIMRPSPPLEYPTSIEPHPHIPGPFRPAPEPTIILGPPPTARELALERVRIRGLGGLEPGTEAIILGPPPTARELALERARIRGLGGLEPGTESIELGAPLTAAERAFARAQKRGLGGLEPETEAIIPGPPATEAPVVGGPEVTPEVAPHIAAMERALERAFKRGLRGPVSLEPGISRPVGLETSISSGETQAMLPKLLTPELEKALDFEMTPLMDRIKTEVIKSSTHWVPGVGWMAAAIDKWNNLVDMTETAKNVANIIGAIGRMKSPGGIWDKLPDIDTQFSNLRLKSVSEMAAEALTGEVKTINLKNEVIKSLINSYVHNWTQTELYLDFAKKIVGEKDIDGIKNIVQSLTSIGLPNIFQ